IIALMAGIVSVKANPIGANTAQTVAANFYATNYASGSPSLELAYTDRDANGSPVYYVFNVKVSAQGFVIVAAEDASHPIIGYSNQGQFVIPSDSHNNVAFWLKRSKEQVVAMRTSNLAASADIASEWNGYISNSIRATHAAASANQHLCATTWNQYPYYNAYCPGGSVTGCVATAMAQIMWYCKYPGV